MPLLGTERVNSTMPWKGNYFVVYYNGFENAATEDFMKER